MKTIKGITLIALVITIIVLIILAGVSISVLTGEGGILQKAKMGATNFQIASDEESSIIKDFDSYIQGNQIVTITTSSTHNNKRNLTAAGIKWNKLSELASIIAYNEGNESNKVNSDTEEVTIILNGTEYVIGVGDTATVTYDGVAKTVRILGFNHDTLASNSNLKAGISFEFSEMMIDADKMNSEEINEGGWETTDLRAKLNSTYLAKLKDDLNSKEMSLYIKPVKKEYIIETTNASKGFTTDSLWFLSNAEIWENYSWAVAKDGDQYKLYKDINARYNGSDSNLVKKDSNGNADYWWSRTMYSTMNFMIVSQYGNNASGANDIEHGVAPCFAI